VILVREIPHGSAAYDEVVELRREVLRRPLGMDYTPEQLAAEADQIHLVAYDGITAVGCLILVGGEDGEVKMRQVAVSPQRQGQGVGRVMVDQTEAFARRMGFNRMVLHAREAAVPFYLSLGYHIEGEPFEEIGIPHRYMAKRL